MRTRLKIAGFLVAVGLCSLPLSLESARILMAAGAGKSSSIAEIRKAISFEPTDPRLHFLLGTVETYNQQTTNSSDGIRQFELATRLSPRQSRYWRALASACELKGDKACVSGAISRSLALDPMDPRIHWEAANYYLWANNEAMALHQFQRLLSLDSHYAGQVFSICLRLTGNPEAVYHDVLPPSAGPGLKLRYINFLAGAGYTDFAFQEWKEVASSPATFEFALADPYLERLISSHQYRQAKVVWRDLEKRGVIQQSAGPGSSDLIFNGGFEHVPLNAGFDWHYRTGSHVGIDFKCGNAYQGRYCLQLNFTDLGNHQDEPVYHLVPVAAGRTYTLTAYVRSASLNSGSGPRLRVVDPACPSCLDVSSDPVLGTTAWHKLTLKFRTGPKTHLVQVSIWRPRSLDYPTEILGTLWVDQVSLAVDAPSPQHPMGKRDS